MPTAGDSGASDEAAQLVERIRKGDRQAEQRLVEVYGRGVALILDRHTNSRPEAQDLYQDTFRIVLERLRRNELREPAKLPGFLAGVARNLAIEHYRKSARRKTDFDSEAVADVPCGAFDQLDRLLEQERAALVRRVIEELNVHRDREILFRFYIAEEDKERIAADLGLESLQFNRVLHRARQRYKELYELRLKRQRNLALWAAATGLLGTLRSWLPTPLGA